MIRRSIALLLVVLTTTACTTVPAQNPDSLKKAASYNAELGSQYLRAGDLKKARTKLQKALKQDSDNAAAHFSYGLLLVRLKQPKEAETHLQRAVTLAPDETHYAEAFGVFSCGQGQYNNASRQFLLAAENPFNSAPEQSYNNLGSCAMTLGRLDDAENNVRLALRKNPRFTPALLNMAELSLEARKIKVADAYYARYLQYGQHTADSLWLGIQIKRFLGDHQTINEYGAILKRDFPQSQQTLEYLESKQL